MKTKNMKKVLATVLSTSMVVGLSMTALADNNTPESTAPIYSLNVASVVVPTKFELAFNPDGLTVKTGDSTTSADEIISRNFGIINKSSKDKIVTATLKVVDGNVTGDEAGDIQFVDSADKITTAGKDDYAIYLTAIPADTTEVQVGTTPASADKDTVAADLNNVTMTKAADTTAQVLHLGDNKIGFKLAKATFAADTGKDIVLGTTNDNSQNNNYKVSALAADGAGITAFTLGGKINKKADWNSVGQGIKISATYSLEDASDSDTPITGTGAMVKVINGPVFTTGDAIGSIEYTTGFGDDALEKINKVEISNQGTYYDGYNAVSKRWFAATDDGSTVVLSDLYVNSYLNSYPDDTELPAKVTYTTVKGVERDATVNVKIREATQATP